MIDSLVVMLHPEKYPRSEELKGVIWRVKGYFEYSKEEEVFLDRFYGPVPAKDLLEVFPDKKYDESKKLYTHTVTEEQYQLVKHFFQSHGISTIEKKVDTWWGGKDCIEFTFLSQYPCNIVGKLLDLDTD